MAELGLTPSEVELIVPKFVITDRDDEIKYWKNQMEDAKSKMDEEVKEVKISTFIFFMPGKSNSVQPIT